MPEEPFDQDHPIIQEIRQIVINHGWEISVNDLIEVVIDTKEELLRYDQRVAQAPDTRHNGRIRETDSILREQLPDVMHTPDGDKPEIPDDLYEEMAAILADHHQVP